MRHKMREQLLASQNETDLSAAYGLQNFYCDRKTLNCKLCLVGIEAPKLYGTVNRQMWVGNFEYMVVSVYNFSFKPHL